MRWDQRVRWIVLVGLMGLTIGGCTEDDEIVTGPVGPSALPGIGSPGLASRLDMGDFRMLQCIAH